MNNRLKIRIYNKILKRYLTDEEIDTYSISDLWKNFDNRVLEQCTGYKDVDKTLIYDGDVIIRCWSDGSIKNTVRVQWLKNNGGWNIGMELLNTKCIAPANSSIFAQGFKIIKTIHDED